MPLGRHCRDGWEEGPRVHRHHPRKYVRMPLSAPPALGVRRQDPVWSWTAPNTNMALYAQQPVLGPLVVGRQGLVQ